MQLHHALRLPSDELAVVTLVGAGGKTSALFRLADEAVAAGAQDPVNCLNETSTLFLFSCIGTRVTLQECVKFLLLIVGDFIGRHPPIGADLTEHDKRQRSLVIGANHTDFQ